MAPAVDRRAVFGLCLAAAAAPLAYRGWIGQWARVRRVHARRLGLHIMESVRFEKPLDEVFQFWQRIENLPLVLRWRSLGGPAILTDGSVNFTTARDGRSTQVSVELRYAPRSVARSLLAALARRKPAEAVREDLRRLKQILEMGVVARTTAVLSRP